MREDETIYKKLRGQDVPMNRDMNKEEIKEFKKNLPKFVQAIFKKKRCDKDVWIK